MIVQSEELRWTIENDTARPKFTQDVELEELLTAHSKII